MTSVLEKLFNRATHVFSASPGGIFPPDGLPEIAFIGRSNVGKSSLINALVRQNKLARTSNTPGATRAVHFYQVADSFNLVDLPGYGYANLSKTAIAEISDWVRQYFTNRRHLRMVCVLVDSRHGMKPSDYEMLKSLAEYGIPALVVLTKADKAKAKETAACLAKVKEDLVCLPGARDEVLVTASHTGQGIEELREFIARA